MNRPFTCDADVAAIGLRLLDRTLPKAEWTHAAHLTAAAWLLTARPDIDAFRDMPGIIRAYNDATGVPNSDTRGYHATITLASLRATRAFLARLPAGTPLHAACNALLASKLADKRWLAAHWRDATLFSPAARHGWVEPDLAALPF